MSTSTIKHRGDHALRLFATGAAAAALLAVLLPASAPRAGSPATPGKDIVDTAVQAGSFKTLVKAVEAAGLVETLKGKGPFTVFAPTDEAFQKLPAGQLDALLKDKAKLTAVLTYHVLSGRTGSADVLKSTQAATIQGQPVFFDTRDGVKINGARVVTPDISASNGVIHVIDSVLLPLDVVDTAIQAGGFSSLVAAVQAAGLVETLKGTGPFTVFAPTDAAFAKLPAGQLEALLKDKAKLTAVLTRHVVPGRLLAAEVVKRTGLATVQGQPLKVASSGGVTVEGARVVATDVLASNGVIHVIDQVILPQYQ